MNASSHYVWLGLTAAALAGTPGDAASRVEGTATITNFQILLTDLDPLDGIDPSLVLGSGTPTGSTLTLIAGASRLALVGPDDFSPLSGVLSEMEAVAAGSIESSGGPVGLMMQAYGSADPFDFNRFISRGYIDTDQQRFVLSPMTGVLLSVDFAASVLATVGDTGPLPGGLHGVEEVSATVTTNFSTPTAGAGIGFGLTNVRGGIRRVVDESVTRTESLSFSNLSTSPIPVRLSFSTTVQGYSHAIPEPSTGCLASLGLAAVVGTAWFRRRTKFRSSAGTTAPPEL